jgi:hypothetical protein
VFALAIVCAIATGASAQVSVVAPGRPVTAAVARVSVETIVAHVLSFDVNGDGRISARELPERMISLIERGDRNRDHVLDADEVAMLARNPLPQVVRAVPTVDQRGDSPRRPPPAGPEALVRELKLPPPRMEAAVAVLEKRKAVGATFAGIPVARDVDEATLRKLAEILTNEELTDLKAALARQRFILPRGAVSSPPASPSTR